MNEALREHLRAALQRTAPPALAVAFSGGPDSSALLHALTQLPQARTRGLRALHVDHGLHADSAAWADHCRRFCAALDIDCAVLTVHVERGSGDGLEAAARDARYAALAAAMRTERTRSIVSGCEPLAGMGVKCRPVVTAIPASRADT